MHLCVTPRQQLIALDAALSRSYIRATDLEGLRRTPLLRRRWLQRLASPLSKSPLETIAGVELTRAGIPFRRQVLIEAVGHVDFRVGKRLVIETDGAQFHASPEAQTEDARRDRELMFRGYRVMRFTYRDVVEHPRAFIADVRAALTLLRDPIAQHWG